MSFSGRHRLNETQVVQVSKFQVSMMPYGFGKVLLGSWNYFERAKLLAVMWFGACEAVQVVSHKEQSACLFWQRQLFFIL